MYCRPGASENDGEAAADDIGFRASSIYRVRVGVNIDDGCGESRGARDSKGVESKRREHCEIGPRGTVQATPLYRVQ